LRFHISEIAQRTSIAKLHTVLSCYCYIQLVQKTKRQLLLAHLPDVLMEHVKLQKVLSAEYLGHIFQSDGGCEEDVTSRMLKARQRFNKLNWLWDDSDLGPAAPAPLTECNNNMKEQYVVCNAGPLGNFRNAQTQNNTW
jgi:hypothetical protein